LIRAFAEMSDGERAALLAFVLGALVIVIGLILSR